MRSKLLQTTTVILVVTLALSLSSHAQSPLFGELEPGPYAVGFKVIKSRDPARPIRGKRDYLGQPVDGDRSRPLEIHVWYPAAGSAGPAMSFEDYLYSAELRLGGAATDTLKRAARAEQHQFLQGRFGGFSDSRWQELLRAPLLARREAPVMSGKFALILGTLRPLSTTITNEYLASHGYVVAMVTSSRPDFTVTSPVYYEDLLRDMEMAYRLMLEQPYVQPERLGLLGFSGAGFAQVLFAMRYPDVDALVDLESAMFTPNLRFTLQEGVGYSVGALRAPFFHAFSVPLSKLETLIGDFENMKYSVRYRYLVDAPKIDHWDFATEGMAASTVLGLRGDAQPALRQAFETTNRYVLNFLNAYVKGEPRALEFLRRPPERNGVPLGMVILEEMPAEPAPLALAEFRALLMTRGAQTALRAYRDWQQRDPMQNIFAENDLNRLGYELLEGEKTREAIEVFKLNVESHPQSPNTYESLSGAYETAEDHALAIATAEEGLRILIAQTDLPEKERAQIRASLENRLARLKKPH